MLWWNILLCVKDLILQWSSTLTVNTYAMVDVSIENESKGNRHTFRCGNCQNCFPSPFWKWVYCRSDNIPIRIHHECQCRIGKSHPRGRDFYPSGEFSYPAWTGSWWILFLPPLSGLFLGPAWSCEIEISHTRVVQKVLSLIGFLSFIPGIF